MTTPPSDPAPDDDRPAGGATGPGDAPGVELGLSEEGGGTFEPEEDPQPEG